MALEYEGGCPKITKDGVTIARSIYLSDMDEELGCKLLKGGSGTTNKFAGDGTTSSVVLTRELVRGGVKAIEYGMHPIDLKIGMRVALDRLLQELRKMCRALPSTKTGIRQVAMISSNNDPKISDILGDSLAALGKDGHFTFDSSPTLESFVEVDCTRT